MPLLLTFQAIILTVPDKANMVYVQKSAAEKFIRFLIFRLFIHPLAFLNRNPIMLKTNSFQVVYFGLFAACGVMASLSISFFYLHAKGCFSGLAPIPVALIILAADVIGVKALYVLALGKTFLRNPKAYLNETTMYNQGGLFVVVIAAAAIAFVKHIDPLLMFDAMVLGSSFGLFLGRLGCYNYGCCFGIPTSSSIHVTYQPSSSKIIHTNPELKGMPLVPTQLYSAYFDLFMFIAFMAIARSHPGNGLITLAFIFLFNGFRVIIQRFRFVEKSDLAGFSKIAVFYFISGLVAWVLLFLAAGGEIVSRPFQVPFTLASWAQFVVGTEIMLALLSAGAISFLFYGIQGKELGTHMNLAPDRKNASMGKIDFPDIFPFADTMNLVFTETLPADEDLKKIEEEAVLEKTVVGYFRPLFKKMFAKGYGLAAYNNTVFLGIMCAVPFGRNWVEPGTFYVLKSYRGCGVGSALVREMLLKFKVNKRIYVATKNPVIIDFCERVGLKQCRNYWSLPVAVKWHLLKKLPMVNYEFMLALKRNFHRGIRFYVSPEE